MAEHTGMTQILLIVYEMHYQSVKFRVAEISGQPSLSGSNQLHVLMLFAVLPESTVDLLSVFQLQS